MSTIQPSRIALPTSGEYDRLVIVDWPNMTTGDVGEPIGLCNYADRTVYAVGSFNGATVRFEGFIGDPLNAVEISNDTYWVPLTDPSDNFLELTESKIEAISQVATLIRPAVMGGTSPSLVIRFQGKR